jgi:hypothetical protein
MSTDEQWLRDRLTGDVPPAPGSPDRLADLTQRRARRQRRRAAVGVFAACAAVGAASLVGVAVLRDDDERRDLVPTEQTSTTQQALGALDCPGSRFAASDSGPEVLPPGAVAARICGSDIGFGAQPPLDVLRSGLDDLVASVNDQPKIDSPLCHGGRGARYLLLLQYPDGTIRRVVLDFSGCGSIRVGRETRQDPSTPYNEFFRLLQRQRATSDAPPVAATPVCLPQNSSMSPIADPGEMVSALLCVSYDEGATTTKVQVPASDLSTILDGWREGPKTPEEKGPGCGPTTPTWVLSGVTVWGDQVQITAECDRPTNGQDWVTLPPAARDAVDRLITQAGVQVANGDEATTAWVLALDWLKAVNARAIVSYDKTAAELADIANRMWVADPWLPDGELDWDLLAATPTDASGWRFAWRVPARTPNGEAVFIVVRDSKDDPWRILSLTR